MKLLGNLIVMVVSAAVLVLVGAVALLMSVPDVRQLEKCFVTSMYKVRLCPTSPQYVPFESISPYMVHALISAEDTAFYSHKGFDWHEIQQSFTTNLLSGHLRRGGSTLTQQLAKNAFLNKDKNIWRKIKEAYLAHAIESQYKKDFILEKYLNVVEFGPNLYGIKAASLYYFQKNPSELHPLEAAFLAFLLPNPKGNSKSFRNGELTPHARKMVGIILKRMLSFGKLSEPAFQTARAHLAEFPWRGLSIDSFHGTPNYSLEAPAVPAADLQLEEGSLEDIVHENESSEEPTVEPAVEPEPPVAAPSEERGDLEE